MFFSLLRVFGHVSVVPSLRTLQEIVLVGKLLIILRTHTHTHAYAQVISGVNMWQHVCGYVNVSSRKIGFCILIQPQQHHASRHSQFGFHLRSSRLRDFSTETLQFTSCTALRVFKATINDCFVGEKEQRCMLRLVGEISASTGKCLQSRHSSLVEEIFQNLLFFKISARR